MSKHNLSRYTITKIFTTYWNAPCLYRKGSNDVWVKGYFGANCLPLIEEGHCILLLKDINELERSNLDMISKIMSGDDNEYEEVLTEEHIRERAEHMSSVIKEIPCAVADYLRREGFHIPVYGIDMFNLGLAQRIGRRNFIKNKNQNSTATQVPENKNKKTFNNKYSYKNNKK